MECRDNGVSEKRGEIQSCLVQIFFLHCGANGRISRYGKLEILNKKIFTSF